MSLKKSVKIDPAWEALSVQELEDLLREDLELPEGQEPDVDQIIGIMEVLKTRDEVMARRGNIDVTAAWEEFQTVYLPLAMEMEEDPGMDIPEERTDEPNREPVADVISLPGQKRRKSSTGKVIGTFVLAAVLCAAIITSASGLNIFELFASWTSSGFQVVEGAEDGQEKPVYSPMQSLQAEVQNYSDLLVVPTWCPEGTEAQQVKVIIMEDFSQLQCAYQQDGREFFVSVIVHPVTPEERPTLFEKDKESVVEYHAGNVIHYVMSNNSVNKAIWSIENLECSISGSLTLDELEKMIDSIYEESF